MNRLREAIECYKRALITADPHEITLHLKLAKVHKTLEEHEESVAYHRTVVKVCQADCKCWGNGINTSLRTYSLPPVRPIQDYAKSVLEIAEHEMKLPNGNLTLATDYLELVASSNAEHVTRAAELLKEVKSKIQEHETEQA